MYFVIVEDVQLKLENDVHLRKKRAELFKTQHYPGNLTSKLYKYT
jgi:hypothetical protein